MSSGAPRDRVRKFLSKSVKGNACKFRFTITYEYVDLKCLNRWQPTCLSVVWFRSHRSKVSEKPTSKVSIVDEKTGIVSYAANWFPPNTVDLVVTLYKDFTGVMFKKKDYMFVIENVTADARKKLAIFPCNMAEYASSHSDVFDLDMEFKSLSKKITSARLGAKVRCEFIKEGREDEDDMQSNFSHLSEAEFKMRLNELAACSDEDEDEEEKDPLSCDKLVDRSKHTWSQFIDEMKTLEYKNAAMIGNPVADVTLNGINSGHNPSALCESSSQPDSNSSKLLERNKERRKVVSALSELKECEEEDEEGSLEKDDDDTPQRTASSTFSSLSSFKHKFQRSFSSSLKTKPKPGGSESPLGSPVQLEGVPSDSSQDRVSMWLQDNQQEDDFSQQRVEKMEKEIMGLKSSYQKLVTTVSDLESEKAELLSEVEQLRLLSKYNKTDFAKERDEFQAEISELQLLVEDLRTQLRQAESELENSREKGTISASIELSQIRGWLCKRGVKGPTGRRWRRRWFSTEMDGKLYYYKRNNNTMPRGIIDLDVIVAVQDQPPSKQDINKSSFNVVTVTRTYELMAHDEDEKLKWINALDYLRHWRNRLSAGEGNF